MSAFCTLTQSQQVSLLDFHKVKREGCLYARESRKTILCNLKNVGEMEKLAHSEVNILIYKFLEGPKCFGDTVNLGLKALSAKK